MKQTTAPAVEIRSYTDSDEKAVLDLLTAAMGAGPAGGRIPEFFRWKHIDNPFGRSYMIVASAEDRIVGLRAFMRWRFRAGEATVTAVRAVDTATHPEFQGGGVFSRLTLQALEDLRRQVDLVFNTPNEKSLPGYLKMGWRVVGRLPVYIRPRRPIRVARNFRTSSEVSDDSPPVEAETAAEVLDDPRVGPLLAAASMADPRLVTPRDTSFLRWRYGAAPRLDYRAVREERGGTLRGLAIFRVRGRGVLREATVADVIARPDDSTTVRRLLRRVTRATSVDHLTCRFAAVRRPALVAATAGYLKAPGGVTFVTNPLHDHVRPDPTSLQSWALTVGDLEVF